MQTKHKGSLKPITIDFIDLVVNNNSTKKYCVATEVVGMYCIDCGEVVYLNGQFINSIGTHPSGQKQHA